MKKTKKELEASPKPYNRRLKASPIGDRARAWIGKLRRKGKKKDVL